MVIDTSVLMAILFEESDRLTYQIAIKSASIARMSAATAVEAGLVAFRRGGAEDVEALDQIVAALGISVHSLDVAQVALARAALQTYGKGQHKARLNFGDSFSYALAIHLGEPLLFKGDDFPQTDVRSAL